MNKALRYIALFAGTGIIWYAAMQLFFIMSGAQNLLANPQYQSDKFIKSFMVYEPLPRMIERGFVLKGLTLTGAFTAFAFVVVNSKLAGSWLKKGLMFACIQWLIMIPWFEFYLPYNVMHEPLSLVMFEGLVWCYCMYRSVYVVCYELPKFLKFHMKT